MQIGLAVGDIEKVRVNARLKRLALQVGHYMDLELGLRKYILKRRDQRVFIVQNSKCGIVLKVNSANLIPQNLTLSSARDV